MKKTLLDKAAAERIIERIMLLQADTPNKWGEMNATEMLHHCNLINSQILQDNVIYKKTTLKQKLIKNLNLYIIPYFPKNVKGKKIFNTKGVINPEQFQEQKNSFIAIVRQFADHKKPINLPHPFFGNLNAREWGIAAWKHLDHHLRQFGL